MQQPCQFSFCAPICLVCMCVCVCVHEHTSGYALEQDSKSLTVARSKCQECNMCVYAFVQGTSTLLPRELKFDQYMTCVCTVSGCHV